MTGLAREASAASATWRTSGLPCKSAVSFVAFGPPPAKRVLRPAASITAATSLIAVVALRLRRFAAARLRPRHDLHQQSAGAEATNVLGADGNVGEQAVEHPVEAVLLRRARAARRTEHRLARARLAEQQEIAGIDGHAELLDRAAGEFDRGRNNIAAVGDRGRAK